MICWQFTLPLSPVLSLFYFMGLSIQHLQALQTSTKGSVTRHLYGQRHPLR